MAQPSQAAPRNDRLLSGVSGFDEITGGLPRGRFTVVLGAAGCGKTIFALQTLLAGASEGEPGLFVTFEEAPERVVQDASHFNWKLAALRDKGISFIDAQLPQAILQGGEFDLLGLLAVVEARAKQLGAKRVVFDGLDVLLSLLGAHSLIRREILALPSHVGLTKVDGALIQRGLAA